MGDVQMLKGKIHFTLLTLAALGIVWSFPLSIQAREPTVLVINTSSGDYGRCCSSFPNAPADRLGTFFDALFRHLDYTDGVDFKEIIDDVAQFDQEVFSGKWDIFIISYHGLQYSATLRAWVDTNADKIEQWVSDGHGIVSTGGRDPEDIPLVAIFGLDTALCPHGMAGFDQCCIRMVPDIPLTKGMEEILDSRKATGAPSLFGQDGQAYGVGSLPQHAQVAALHPNNDDIAAIVYGRFGRGAYVFGTAEITNLDMGFGIPDMSEDSFTFWVNMMNWFAEEMLAVPNLTDDLPTTWGYIRRRS
jgi:hypothetical protein